MSEENPNLYPIRIQGTPEQLRYLAGCGATPQDPIIFMMTEEQHRNMPGAGDIRDNILFKRETPDGLSFLASMDDCNFCLTDLLDCYNEENPNSTYCDTRNPRELDTPTTHRLIRTIAISCDMDMKIRPANTRLKVTEVMEQEGLSPEDIFIPEE